MKSGTCQAGVILSTGLKKHNSTACQQFRASDGRASVQRGGNKSGKSGCRSGQVGPLGPWGGGARSAQSGGREKPQGARGERAAEVAAKRRAKAANGARGAARCGGRRRRVPTRADPLQRTGVAQNYHGNT